MCSDWVTNDKGNRVLVDGLSVLATVFRKEDNTWGAIIDGRLLIESADYAEDMMARVHDALLNPNTARYAIQRGVWQPGNKSGYYKQGERGIISVKQARSGSWYAATQDGILPSPEKPKWCKTADEAMQLADSLVLHLGSQPATSGRP